MKQTADVVVIGGGIQGVSALYYLAELGLEVRLVEMDALGSGITFFTAGWFVTQVRWELNVRMSQLSLGEYLQFEDKFGEKVPYHRIGTLSINTVEHTQEMLALADRYGSWDVPVQVLYARDIKKIAPFLNLSDIGVGLYCDRDGRLDTAYVLGVYAKHAKRLGAKIDEGVTATGILVRNGKVKGVKTTRGDIATPVVVNAAGTYDRVVASWAGVELPTAKRRRYTIYTEPTSLIPNGSPLVEVLNPEPIYISREGGIATYSVGLELTDSSNHIRECNANVLSHIDAVYGKALQHRIPELYELGIQHCLGGLRSVPHSEQGVPQVGRTLPILGPVKQVEGYINDCAWGGLGVTHAPVGGMFIAECVAGVDIIPLDIEPFLLESHRPAQPQSMIERGISCHEEQS